jgi:C1A family cysteine protease
MFYGSKLSPYDARDYKVACGASSNELPDAFELDFSNIKIKNQGRVSSCVAHAMSTILEYHAKGLYDLSTNFIYGAQLKYCGRSDKGMYLRDACKIATKLGDATLEDCPGNNEVPQCHEIADRAMMSEDAMNRAADFRTKSYYVCKNNDDIKYALVNYGPILASIQWFDDLKVKNGVLTKGKSKEGGYHAFVIYGYNEQGFLCQNSWGKLWGKGGRFILPYDFKIREARGLIDLENDTFVTPPKKSKWAEYLYKLVNLIINLLRKLNKT